MNVLISIKPKYVEKIISKEKTYEFRRNIFKKEVEKIVIYSTSPEKKIIGCFKSNKIIKDCPKNLWNNFSEEAGINEEDFFDYFENKEEGFALKIDELEIFGNPIETDKLEDFSAPQSFKYMNENDMTNLIEYI
ncbi:50S ribosomal protein L22/unknown domain fusion protein [Methanobrevibacter cuticularis]|uniref:ASCH domain-containing protein n=1 Tax=Methanobrevibacter cuticularis TaxID=47311 RepID=A0A166CR41_9EURY|nr:ASCH domain-containing protein [Methanobrevibacter cuticularis]KZX16177.1 50S ribosomal protein L22/unknown domain fusion protein [Methanobrevibacter cuticularis]